MNLVFTLLAKIIWLITQTPIYPHWLQSLKTAQGMDHVCGGLKGIVLEVGAGDGARKAEFKQKYPAIKKYVATDYSSWDGEFDKINKNISRLGQLAEVFYGFKQRIKLDAVADATKLPFKDNLFDYHLSFEVLEHISDPFAFIHEATRVLRKGGKIIISAPFMFRIHGGEPLHKMDSFRYAPGFYYAVADRYGLKVKDVYINTGVGTSVAQAMNQWLILRITEGGLLIKVPLILICPFYFAFFNLIGYLLDLVPDKRFPVRIFAVLEKC